MTELVKAPDGTVYDMEGAPPEVRQKMKETWQRQGTSTEFASELKRAATSLGGMATDLGRGAFRGLAGLGELFSKTPEGVMMEQFAPVDAPPMPSAEELTQRFIPTPQGDSTARRYLRGALESVGGGIATGGVSPVSLFSAATAGLAEQGAKEYASNIPLAQMGAGILGGVAGGSVAGLATRIRPQSANIAKELIEGLTETDLKVASEFMRKSAAEGAPVDLAQALVATKGYAGNIESFRNALAGRSQGNKVQAILRGQPENLRIQAGMLLEELPGNSVGGLQNANNLQQTATEVIQLSKEARTKLWEQTLKDGVAALKASEGVKVAEAAAFEAATGQSLAQARSKTAKLLQEIAGSSQADKGVVEALAKRYASMRETIESLQQFTLPRGSAFTNRGSFSDLPARGQSIAHDALTREAAAERLSRDILPLPTAGDSSKTLRLQEALTKAQAEEAAALSKTLEAKKLSTGVQQQAVATTRLPPAVVDAVHAKLDKLIASFPGAVEGKELAGLKANLITPTGPLTDPRQINRVLTQFTTRLKSPDLKTAGMDAGISKYLGTIVDDMRESFGAGFAPIRQANTAYRNYTNDVLDPLRQGPVGILARPAGYHADTQATLTPFAQLMNQGVDITGSGAKISPVATAAKELAKVDPAVFEANFKGWLTSKVNDASSSAAAGAGLGELDPKKFYDAVFHKPHIWQAVKDAAGTMADIRGVDKVSYVRGLENLKQLTKAMVSRSATQGISAEDIKRLGGQSASADLVRLAGMMPLNRIGERMEIGTLGRTLQQFDTILTDPDYVKLLVELGKVPVMSKKAQVILGTFGGMVGNPPELLNSNPKEK